MLYSTSWKCVPFDLHLYFTHIPPSDSGNHRSVLCPYKTGCFWFCRGVRAYSFCLCPCDLVPLASCPLSIHDVANGRISLSLLNNMPLYTCHIFSIHSPGHGHWGCPHVFSTVTVLQWTWGWGQLHKLVVSFPLDKHPENGWTLRRLFLIFWGIPTLPSIVAFTFPPTAQRLPFSPYSHGHFLFLDCLFDDSHSNRREVIPHCDFDVHFWTP